ncbi:MAG: serine protease [Acidobacteriota bacterium]
MPSILPSIARLTSTFAGGRRTRGTAFLVAPGLALTACHLVAESEDGSLSSAEEITLLFGRETVSARLRLDLCDPDLDWAVLECDASERRPFLPTGSIEDHAPDASTAAWSTFGYPASNPVDGLAVAGTVRSLEALVRGAPAYQLFADEAAAGGGAPMAGLSGAPVLVDGVVVGLIRYGLADTERNTRAGTLFACPMASILEQCNDLLPRPDLYWGLPGLPHRSLPQPPFRYLEQYSKDEAAVFFGRGDVIRELYDFCTKPNHSPVLLFYGQAGAGKSSVLSAGLEPRLAWHHDLIYRRRRQGSTLLEVVLQDVLEAHTHEPSETPELSVAWRRREERTGRPLIFILDQIEEAFIPSLSAGQQELKELVEALASLLGEARSGRGRLLLSFRKEWLAEIEAVLHPTSLRFSKTFLQPLGDGAIREVVGGLASTASLRGFYRCRIDDDLPGLVAAELGADDESPIAPTLQILLTKLWQSALEEDDEEPHWTRRLYRSVAKKGTHLDKFLGETIDGFRDRFPKAYAAGLHLDILDFFTTSRSTARTCSAGEFERFYEHLDTPMNAVREYLVDSYVLAVPPKGPQDSLRLAHDTLGPLVRKRFEASNRPAQIARRILDTKALSGGGEASRLSSSELRLIERARGHMRRVSESEEGRIDRARQRRHRWRIAATSTLALTLATLGVFLFAGSTVRHGVHRLVLVDTWNRTTRGAADVESALGARQSQTLYCDWFQPYAAGLMIMPTSELAGSPKDSDIAGSFFLLGKQAADGDAKSWMRVPGEEIEGISDLDLFRRTLDLGRSRLLRDGYDLPFPQLFERNDARTIALFEERAVRGGFAHILARFNVDLAFGGPSKEGDGDYNTECSTSLLLVEYEQALVISGAPNGACYETQNHYILHTDGSWQRLRRAPFFPDIFRGHCADL